MHGSARVVARNYRSGSNLHTHMESTIITANGVVRVVVDKIDSYSTLLECSSVRPAVMGRSTKASRSHVVRTASSGAHKLMMASHSTAPRTSVLTPVGISLNHMKMILTSVNVWMSVRAGDMHYGTIFECVFWTAQLYLVDAYPGVAMGSTCLTWRSSHNRARASWVAWVACVAVMATRSNTAESTSASAAARRHFHRCSDWTCCSASTISAVVSAWSTATNHGFWQHLTPA